ncbi:MAG: beta-lactamase family protein [Myxococcales bacterium]|nr:beta-lactamase family protein [Myxococcales bacterium]
MRSNLACVLGLLLTTAACASDSDDPKTDPEFPEAAARDLQQTLDTVVAEGVAPGVSITIEHPVHRRYVGAAGVANRETGAVLTPNARFRAGSMLKPAVATAVLQLVEQGKRSLDDKLTAVLPVAITARVAEASRITLRMLLDHTSGIPDYSTEAHDGEILRDPKRVWALDELLERSAVRERTFAPGAGWSYSNTNYVLLGEVLVATTGKPWREIVEDRVLRRAGLHHSSLPSPGDAACFGCARGYEVGEAAFFDATEIDPSMAAAAGGHALITTPTDLATFLHALEAGELFDHDATLAEMNRFVDAPVPEEVQTGYGLGITHFEIGELDLVGHLGGTAGYQGFMLMDTQRGVVISGYMTQRGDLGALIVPVLDAVARIP